MKKDKKWIDHKGQEVPAKYVDNYTKSKEKVIEKIFAEAEKLNKLLYNFKMGSFIQCDQLYEQMFAINNVEKRQDAKGNYTLYTFDKSIKIEVSVQDIIDFDDRIQLAQEKINQFLEMKTAGADQDLSLLVNNAFKTTKGRLDKARVFSLFSLNITHPIWSEAIELIKKSITTNSTRRYISVSKRDEMGKYNIINLNISSI